jgi:hypothetical protein
MTADELRYLARQLGFCANTLDRRNAATQGAEI